MRAYVSVSVRLCASKWAGRHPLPGAILPLTPILVTDLGMTTDQFGLAVSAFGLAKLASNVPAAVLVDIVGRRALLVGGLTTIGCGFVGVGLASGFSHFAAARFVTGAGVSALMCGATMTVTDISTPLNRARMMAPMSMSFNAGALLGPTVGAGLSQIVGVGPSFYVMGAVFALNAMYTRLFLPETLSSLNKAPEVTTTNAHAVNPSSGAGTGATSDSGASATEGDKTEGKGEQAPGVVAAFQQTLGKWGPLLLNNSDLRATCMVNGAYWVSFAGANMTLLPLMLVSDRLELTPMGKIPPGHIWLPTHHGRVHLISCMLLRRYRSGLWTAKCDFPRGGGTSGHYHR